MQCSVCVCVFELMLLFPEFVLTWLIYFYSHLHRLLLVSQTNAAEAQKEKDSDMMSSDSEHFQHLCV